MRSTAFVQASASSQRIQPYERRGCGGHPAEKATADVAEERAARPPDKMGVLFRVAGRDSAIESNCVMASAAETPFVCHAFAGPDDAWLPPPRATASLIVTGTLNRAGSEAEPVAMTDTTLALVAAPGDANMVAARLGRVAAITPRVRGSAMGARQVRRVGERLHGYSFTTG